MDWVLLTSPHKDRIGLTSHPTPGVDAKILNGANHIVETHKICSPKNGKNYGTDESPNKAFNRLLGRQLYKRCPAHSYTPDVGEAIIADNK
jgi:hypothetical protein